MLEEDAGKDAWVRRTLGSGLVLCTSSSTASASGQMKEIRIKELSESLFRAVSSLLRN